MLMGSALILDRCSVRVNEKEEERHVFFPFFLFLYKTIYQFM